MASLDPASSSAPLLSEEAVPRGFRFAAVRAGIKPSGKPDFACAVADAPASAAAMFTSNRVVAAPVTLGREHLRRSHGRIQAVAVNAGNANCATGEAGLKAATRVCAAAAEAFGCAPHEVFPSSTGIIGVPLPDEKLIAALPAIQRGLGSSAAHFEQMARAILTTDTRPKVAATCFEADGAPSRTIRLAGMAKGAGMIHPKLQAAPHATMLVYLFTDAALEPAAAAGMLTRASETSFNRISIDGDTSTNDTVLLLASGVSGVSIPAEDPSFSSALHAVCLSLAKQIVADGEGIGHVVELDIQGARTDADALAIARAIAHSPLVKTAWAGSDPNWGRILAAIGYSGAAIDPSLVGIRFGDLEICRAGGLAPGFDEAAAHAYLKQPEFTVHIQLGQGKGSCRFWTTDLTAEYVHINADYST